MKKGKFLFFILRSKDINIMGVDILAEKDNSNITLNAEKDINIKGSMISTEGENKEIRA